MFKGLYGILRTPDDVGGGASSGDVSFAAELEAALGAPEDAGDNEPEVTEPDAGGDEPGAEGEAEGEAADEGTEESADADDSETAEESAEEQKPDADARESQAEEGADDWGEFDRDAELKREYAEAAKPLAADLRHAKAEAARLQAAYETADKAYKARREEGYDPTDDEIDARNDLRQDWRAAQQRLNQIQAQVNDAFEVAEERVRAWDFFRENKAKFAGFSRSEIATLIDSGAVHLDADTTLAILHGRRVLAGKGAEQANKPKPKGPEAAEIARKLEAQERAKRERASLTKGRGSGGRSPIQAGSRQQYGANLPADQKAAVNALAAKFWGNS